MQNRFDGDTTPSTHYNRQTITNGGASHVINHFDQSVKSALKTNKCPLSGRLSTGQGRSKKMKCLNFQMKKKSDGFFKTPCIRLTAVWNEICIFILSFKVVLLADTAWPWEAGVLGVLQHPRNFSRGGGA